MRCRPSLAPFRARSFYRCRGTRHRGAYAPAASVQTSGAVARAGLSAPGVFGFTCGRARLFAKSGLHGTCTNVTRKASRMNTCAKRVGGWWPRTTLARKGYLLRRNVYQQDELSPVKRVALFAVNE